MSVDIKKTVLLIENDPFIARSYEYQMVSSGIDVKKALNGEEGLKTALLIHPTLVILGDTESDFKKVSILDKLRSDSWGKDVKVVIVCDSFSNEEMQKVKDLNVSEVILKASITPKELVLKIKKYV